MVPVSADKFIDKTPLSLAPPRRFMSMKKFEWFIILLIFSFPAFASSQNNYFVKDTLTSIGADLVEGKTLANQMVCQVRQGDSIIQYTPWQVSEYGFYDGRTFVARSIPLPDSTQKVFLERLVRGKYYLYYYEGESGRTFFLEKDSTLFVALPKHGQGDHPGNFRDDLRHYTADCPKMADAIKLVRYNRAGYKKLMNQYEVCKKRPFPFFRFGISAGYSASKLIPKQSISIPEINEMMYKYEGGFIAGLFAESPVLLSDISLVLEMLFTRHEFSANVSDIYHCELDYYAGMYSFQMPFMVRYAFPSNRIRPFVNAGAVFMYNFSQEENLYSSIESQNVIVINDVVETSLITQAMLGYTLGAGFAVQILPRNWISLDFRYNGYYAIESAQAMDISEFQIKSSISF